MNTRDTPSPQPLSAARAVVLEEESASTERWRQWQIGNAASSRRSAMQVRIAFIVLFAGLGAWLALLLLSPSLRA